MRIKTLFIILILSLVLLPVTPVLAEEVTVNDIAEELMCQCGCTMVLSTCQCGTRDAMVATIEQKLVEGQSKDEIIQYFVAQYGEQVLASPPKKGFNLVVWILPFASILVGGVVVYLVVRAWVRRGGQSLISDMSEKEDEGYQEQLEKELEEFSEGGFR